MADRVNKTYELALTTSYPRLVGWRCGKLARPFTGGTNLVAKVPSPNGEIGFRSWGSALVFGKKDPGHRHQTALPQMCRVGNAHHNLAKVGNAPPTTWRRWAMPTLR